jgi:DNA-binding Lrp family transcriptional regulator
MVTSIILINAERHRIKDLAEELSGHAGISEVYSVSGRYDLIVVVRVTDNDALADLVTDFMAKLDGITHTESMLAFRAYSQHDLEGMFAIGQ